MSRPEKERKVSLPPIYTGFKPFGVSGKQLEKVSLSIDEYEAFRLSDYLGMSQDEAASEMEISRSTFTRLIEKARKKISDFIIHGKILVVEGGNIHFRSNIIKCENCGHMFKTCFKILIDKCPNCNSNKLVNLAGGFGHGMCCIK